MKASRPLRVDQDLPDQDREPPGISGEQIRRFTLVGLAGAALLVLAVGSVSFSAGKRAAASSPATATIVRVRTAPTAAPFASSLPSPTPACALLGREITTITELVDTGQLSLASELARHHLLTAVPRPCALTAHRLARLAYAAKAQQLLAAPAADGGASARETWVALEEWADAHDIADDMRLRPGTVFHQSYNLGLWALAREAFARLWAQDAQVSANATLIEKYVAVLRNWGNHLHETGERARAEQMLATAQAIADALRLPIGTPCADLEAWGIEHCRSVPPDYADPVYAAISSLQEAP